MSRKVLFIRPPFITTLDFAGILPNKSFGEINELELGVLYIASFIEQKGVSVEFLDMALCRDSYRRLSSILNTSRFDFVGITSYSNTIKVANEIAGVIKKQTNAKTVIGGVHASALPEETMRRFGNFDYLVYGEGEETFSELVLTSDVASIKGLAWRNDKQIIINSPRAAIENLDNLPFPARHLVDINKYIPSPTSYFSLPSSGILSSRGCPFDCTFCGRSGTRFQNSIKYRSVDNVIEEIKFCMDKYNIHDFRFYDDIFVIPKQRLLEFCNKIIQRKIKINWMCYSRIDTINVEMLKMMKASGCYLIRYGVDFGTKKWMEKTKKNTTLEQARLAIANTKRVGIAMKASFIIGMPGESIEEIKQTIKFAKELNAAYTTFNTYAPLPGSKIFQDAKSNGTLLNDDYDSYFSSSRKAKLLKDQLDYEILEKLQRDGHKDVYLNINFILYRLGLLIRNCSFNEIKKIMNGFGYMLRILFRFDR